MKNLFVVLLAAATVTFWTSFDDPLVDVAQATKHPTPMIIRTEEVPFAQTWSTFSPPNPPSQPARPPQAAAMMVTPAAQPAQVEASLSGEAELRRVTEMEIRRMKEFGIGISEDGLGTLGSEGTMAFAHEAISE